MVLLLLHLKPEAFFLTLNLTYLNILEAEAVFALKQGRTFRTRGGKDSLNTNLNFFCNYPEDVQKHVRTEAD